MEQAIEEVTPTPPEKEVEGQEEEKKDEGLEWELQLSPMDVDKVLVNGIELTEDSSFATLRAAFQAVYAKILNRNKKQKLKRQEGQMPDEATQARHRLTHTPYANWCKECVEHQARPDRRERTDGVKRGSIPEVSFDFCYTRARDPETKFAGSFVEGVQSRLGIKIGSDHALWTWAARHASWASQRTSSRIC